MKTSILVTSGGGFDAGVVSPGILPEGNTSITEPFELRDEVMNQLGTMFTSNCFNKSEKLQLQAWISDRLFMNKQIAEFMNVFRLRTAAQIEEQWEEAKEAVRRQQKRIEDFNKESAALQRELNRRAGLKGKAFHDLIEARAEREQLSRFSSRKQLESANLLVTQRETVAAEAELEAAKIQQLLNNRAMVQMQPLMEELNRLAAEEMKLRAAVSGESFTDEFGLVHPARK